LEKSLEDLRKGDVIAVSFPFSDGSGAKRRPALVIAASDRHNILICPITSKPGRDYEIKLEDQNFSGGKLDLSPYYIRPNIIATADKSNVTRYVGRVKTEKVSQVIDQIIAILQKPPEPPPPASPALERGKRPKL
jgi:mRNA interferase MazF